MEAPLWILLVYSSVGTVDGIYNHLYRYRLYTHASSFTEHLSHTFLAPLKFVEEIRSPEEFYLRPHLFREKFPQDRRIEIPAEPEARIRAQEEAGRLVFTLAVRARSQ